MKRFKIFISSVQKEFTAERSLLCDYIREDALLGQYFETFIFERSSASDRSAKQVYMQEVERCDIYLGILGTQYGYRDSKGISPTEQEYDCATKLGKRRLIYIRHTPAASREPEEQRFIHKVEQDVTRKSFDTAEGLRSAVDIVRKCAEYGLRAPEFRQEDGFRVIIWRPKRAQSDPNSDPNSVPNDPNLDPNKIAQLLEELRQDGTLSRKILATRIGLSERQVRNMQEVLMNQGKLKRAGSTRGRWLVHEEGDPNDPNSVPNDPNLDPNRVTILLNELRRDATLSRKELAAHLGISDRQVRHLLNALQERGHLRREGSTTRGKWVVLTPINGGNHS